VSKLFGIEGLMKNVNFIALSVVVVPYKHSKPFPGWVIP
jgi:hypothetical protein